MFQGEKVAVVIPAFNEAIQIARVLSRVPAYVDHIICVNDGSTDTTACVLRATTESRLVVLTHAERQGVGAALRSGFQEAFRREMDIVVTLDADNQFNPDEIRDLMQPILNGTADLAKGNRFRKLSSRSHMPILRYWGNRWFTYLQQLAIRKRYVEDAQCGFNAFHTGCLRQIDLASLWTGFGVYNDLLFRLVRVGARVQNVDVTVTYGNEKSHINFFVTIPRILGLFVSQFLNFRKPCLKSKKYSLLQPHSR